MSSTHQCIQGGKIQSTQRLILVQDNHRDYCGFICLLQERIIIVKKNNQLVFFSAYLGLIDKSSISLVGCQRQMSHFKCFILDLLCQEMWHPLFTIQRSERIIFFLPLDHKRVIWQLLTLQKFYHFISNLEWDSPLPVAI